MSSYFDKLPEFLQRYIYKNRWTGFREVQTQAFNILFNTDNHLLISSGTSSGKTEAAAFPVITSLYESPCKGFGCLYISPLKALINDQFERLNGILNETNVVVHSWHGDVTASSKNKILNNPHGILQITPESLQTLIYRNINDIKKIFSELRFVIIDEIHTFMNSDRGLQLLCELETIEKLTGCQPRRIGLSATLSNFDEAEHWLKSNSNRDVSLVSIPSETKPWFKIHYYDVPPLKQKELRKDVVNNYYLDLFNQTDRYNCIIFANDRETVEHTKYALDKYNQLFGSKKKIVVHHGSISAEYRQYAEKSLKEDNFKTTAIATSTLELGIDVGNLDRVIHLNSPNSCSSFAQKLGRSGRRSGFPVMVELCHNGRDNSHLHFELIKSMAIYELFLKDHWVEPINYDHHPYSLLYQQTMLFVYYNFDVTPRQLKSFILSMFPFKNITVHEYKLFLQNLIELDHLVLDDGIFLIGAAGEKNVSKYHFGTIFQTPKEIQVKYDGKIIGTIQLNTRKEGLIQLAGQSWAIKGSNSSNTIIEVEPTDSPTRTFWHSGKAPTHERIFMKMREILSKTDDPGYLNDSAKACLKSAREYSLRTGYLKTIYELSKKRIISNDDEIDVFTFRITPWIGTIQFETLVRILKLIPEINIIDVNFELSIIIETTLNE